MKNVKADVAKAGATAAEAATGILRFFMKVKMQVKHARFIIPVRSMMAQSSIPHLIVVSRLNLSAVQA